jgi:hypothetical protein
VAIATRPDWAQGASPVLLHNGQVLFVGGGTAMINGWGYPSRVVAIYNPATGSLKTTNTMKDQRACPVAVTLQDGRVLVAGGGTSTAELFDPATRTWSRTGSLLGPADCVEGILLPSGEVLVPGNINEPRVQLYDPETGKFRWGAAAPTKADMRTFTLLADGRVLFVGGGENAFMAGDISVFASAEIYDPVADTFSPTGPLVKPRKNHVAALLPDGRVLVAGGSNLKGVYNSAEIWDPATGKFAETGWLAGARQNASATTLADGRVLVAGGSNYPNSPLFAELYDPATGKFARGASMTWERTSPDAILLADGRVLVSLGTFGDGPYAQFFWP